MKRMLSLLLIFSLLLCMPGCGEDAPQVPGQFYYCRTESSFTGQDSFIVSETRELKGMEDDLPAILNTYLSGPLSGSLTCPFPRDTEILSVRQIDDSIHLNFSSTFAQLSGVDLTVACACIAKTCMELTGAQTVRIRASGELLNGSTYVTMNSQTLNFTDDSLDKLRTELTLYYTDSRRRYLIGHNVSVNLANQDSMVSYLVDQLLAPPENMGLVSPLPRGTKLLNFRISDGLCTLDFSQEFEQNAFSQSYAQRTTLLSLVNTLTLLEGIDRVEFHLEGNLMARYQELTLSKALSYDESIIGPVRTGMNEFDATLYLANGSSQYLAAVPVRIRSAAGITQAEQVVEQLLNYSNENGFYSTIPNETALNSLQIEDGLCTVDLSGQFLKNTEQLLLSVRSIVASVCALEDIDRVRITVDGRTPVGDFGDLFLPQSPGSDWYL